MCIVNTKAAPQDIHRALVERSERADDFAVAVVLKAEGSTPAKAGAKAIIENDGSIRGTIGGGLVEAEAQRLARAAIQTGRPTVFDYDLEGGAVAGGNPICGGNMRVLIDPAARRHHAAWAAAAAARQRHERGVLLTTLHGSLSVFENSNSGCSSRRKEAPIPSARAGATVESQSLLTSAATSQPPSQSWHVSARFLSEQALPPDLEFPEAEAIRGVLKREEPALFVAEPIRGEKSPKQDFALGTSEPTSPLTPTLSPDGGEGEKQAVHGKRRLEVLVEPILPQPVLLIVGGGHVGQALARQASLVGFRIAVIDDRPEFTAPELFPEETTVRCGPMGKEVAAFPLDLDTYVVIVTRGPQPDAEALAACLRRPVAYLGMIGSRRKVAMMRQEFLASGRATAEEFNRLHAPVGLEIGAVTVPEIATSIVAQLIAVRRKRRAV